MNHEEIDVRVRTTKEAVEHWLDGDDPGLELQNLLEACADRAAEHAPRLGSQAADVVPVGLAPDSDWVQHQPPGSDRPLWLHVCHNEAHWEKPEPGTGPPATQYQAGDVLQAYQVRRPCPASVLSPRRVVAPPLCAATWGLPHRSKGGPRTGFPRSANSPL